MIPEDILAELIDDQRFLNVLRAAGVDDWIGYENALEMMEDMYPSEEIR